MNHEDAVVTAGFAFLEEGVKIIAEAVFDLPVPLKSVIIFWFFIVQNSLLTLKIQILTNLANRHVGRILTIR